MSRRRDEAGNSRRLLAGAEAAARWPRGPGQHLPPLVWKPHPPPRPVSLLVQKRETGGLGEHSVASLCPCLPLVVQSSGSWRAPRPGLGACSQRPLCHHCHHAALAPRITVTCAEVECAGMACKPALATGSQYSLHLLPPDCHCGTVGTAVTWSPVSLSSAVTREQRPSLEGQGDSGTAGRGVRCGLQALSAGVCTRQPHSCRCV